jgi:hypothetical protein
MDDACYTRYSTSDMCHFYSAGLCSAGLFPIYFPYLQGRKFESETTPEPSRDVGQML